MARDQEQGSRMAAVVYRRVSTTEQADSGLGLTAQLVACRQYAEAHGLEIVADYVDAGVSGGKPLAECPALLEALAVLPVGGVLLVARRDRLGRDVFRVASIEVEVQRRRGSVVSAAGEGNGDDPSSLFLRRILDASAEHVRAVLRARTRAALAVKRSKGERLGTTPTGYITTEEGVLVGLPEELAAVERARELHRAGVSLRKVAERLEAEGFRPKRSGRWHASTVRSIVRRRYVEEAGLVA